MNDGVNAATREGLYAIIDWHVLNDATPLANVQGAEDFFATMSSRYGTHDNVIYEICNEPGSTPWSDVKAYAEQVIPVIRANDPDAVVIVGTTLDGTTDTPISNPLEGESSENVLYGIDSTDGMARDASLRDDLAQALDAGLPVFVSEYGTSESALAPTAEGDGSSWAQLADERNVSFSCDSLSDRDLAAGLAEAGYVTQGDLGEWQENGFNDEGSWQNACLKDSLGLL